MLKINKIEEKCSDYTMKHESEIADVWKLAGTKQTIEWGGMKQCLAILELQGLINIIKQLDINTDLNKYKQMWKALNYLWGINCCFELSLGNKLPENQLYLWKFGEN